MYDNEVRNKNLFKKLFNIFEGVIVVILAGIISDKCFHGTLSSHVIIMVVFFVLLIPINVFIERKISKEN